MEACKRELFERNNAALGLNKNIETLVSDLVANVQDEDFRNEVEAMVFENDSIASDIYTVECLIKRAKRPEVLVWCSNLIDGIEKKIALLSNSCELMKSILDKRAAGGGVLGNN